MPGKGEIMGRFLKKIKNKQYGQAMVEFALTLPIFLIIVVGIIELSRFFLVYSSVYTASREAARYGSSVGGWENETPNYQDCEGIIDTAVNSGWFGGVTEENVNIFYESSPGVEPITNCPYNVPLGYRIVVEVNAVYQPILVGWVLPNGITVNSSNGRTIIKEIMMVATPMEQPICEIDVILKPTNAAIIDKKKAYIDVENKSTFSNYSLEGITNIVDSLDPAEKNYLVAVYWGGDVIWSAKESDEATPSEIVEFEKSETRNLPAGFIKRLEFEYKFMLPEGFSVGFNMKIQNAANYGLQCTKSISLN